MRIGIFADNARGMGGQFQYSIMFMDALLNGGIKHEIYVFYIHDEDNLAKKYSKKNIVWIEIGKRLRSREIRENIKRAIIGLSGPLGRRIAAKARSRYALDSVERLKNKFLKKYDINFIFFLSWVEYCWECGIPFGIAVHDLQHRLQPEFPEVSLNGEREWRENYFSKAVPAAQSVLVDSEQGKRDLLRFYKCKPERIKILPYTLPSTCEQHPSEEERGAIVRKFKLPARFFFYPANFWPHKNHYRIIEAAVLIKKRHGVEIPVVFTGKDIPEWGVLKKCRSSARVCSIEPQIHYLGYISDKELAALYMTAAGLAMPTFFGPTNLPYIEAFYHKCPVIASDIPGIREQVKDAAVLVDPKDSEAIAGAMYNIWLDEKLRAELIGKGLRRLEELSPQRFKESLVQVIDGLAKECVYE